jgi:hypothetical protein
MAKYTRDQIIELLRAAGIPEADIPTMVGIALAESNGNTNAQGDQKLANDKWGNSVGLFQIRSLRDPSKYKGVDSLRDAAKLEDPVFNAKAAWAISKQGKDFTPWTTFNEGTYQKYMDGTSTPSRGRGPKVFKGKGKVLGNLDNIFGTPDDEDVISLSFLNTLAELSGLNYLVADLNSGKIQPEAAQDIIRKSKFFQENVKATRDALLLQKTDPATFNDTIENYKDEIRQTFIDAGAQYNEKQIADLANKAALFKLKKEDFVKIVSDSVDFQSSYLRGLANSYATGVRKTASSYGITLPDGSKELKNFVKAKFTGAMSDDDITAVFREEAIKAFPNFKARFEAGATLDDVAKPFRDDIASTLELNSEDIGYNDNLLKSVLTATNPKDGSPYAMSRAEVTKLAMNDSRFDSTKKAQDMLTTPLLQLVYGRY